MDIETFLLERNQSEFENEVEINLTESGVHPLTVRGLLDDAELREFLALPISYGHTEGTPALRRAIASWYPGATADNVLATTGASEANFVTAWSLLGAGRTLAYMLPNFMQLAGTARSFGSEVRTFSLRPEADWALDVDGLARAVTPTTALISLVNPNNPSGRILTDAEMAAVIDVAARVGAWLHVDEIYRGAELGEQSETPTFWGRYDKVIVTSSTSKALAHAGLRLGWVVAPPGFIYECMRRQDYTTIGSSPLSQFLAERLLRPERRTAVLARSRKILTANLHRFEEWAAAIGGGLSYRRPQAGGMVFFRYPWVVNSTELSRRLRERESVFVVAGDWFGMDQHLRIGLGSEPDKLNAGLERLGRFISSLPRS
jgi:aspartate/methionine/tyrosine aminotransferase